MEMEQRNADDVEKNEMNSSDEMEMALVREIRMLRTVTTADELVRSLTTPETETNEKENRGELSKFDSLFYYRRWILHRYYSAWHGQLKVKDLIVEMKLPIVLGNKNLVRHCFPEGDCPTLEVTKMVICTEAMQEKLSNRQMIPFEYCLLVGIPYGKEYKEACFRKVRIDHLLEGRNAAGVFLKYGTESTFVLYIMSSKMFLKSKLHKSQKVITMVKRICGIIFLILRPVLKNSIR